MAMKSWIRLTANMSLGAYEVFEATGDLPEPEWPDLPFPEILKIAFRDRIVDRADHPLVQRLRGRSSDDGVAGSVADRRTESAAAMPATRRARRRRMRAPRQK